LALRTDRQSYFNSFLFYLNLFVIVIKLGEKASDSDGGMGASKESE
jgi:hypothetical protein